MTYLFTCLIVSDRFTAVNLSLSYIYNSIFIIQKSYQIFPCLRCIFVGIFSMSVNVSILWFPPMMCLNPPATINPCFTYVFMSICLYVYLSSCFLFAYMSTCQSKWLNVYLFICVSVYMHIHVLCLASYVIVIILISLRDTIGQRQYRDLSIDSTGQRQ